MHPVYRQTCRICGSTHLATAIDLGQQYLQGSFSKPGTIQPPMRKLPTRLVRCDVTVNEHGCGLLQLAHSFPPEILYANYWYRSGTNKTMRDHLRRSCTASLRSYRRPNRPYSISAAMTERCWRTIRPDRPDMASIPPISPMRSATAPASSTPCSPPTGPGRASGRRHRCRDLDRDVLRSRGPCRVCPQYQVCSRKADGVWIFEMSYLPLMLLQNSFDTICHEHLEYYSLAVLETIMRKADLRIFQVSINDINGGSIRCYACNASNNDYGTPATATSWLGSASRNSRWSSTRAPLCRVPASDRPAQGGSDQAAVRHSRPGQRIHVYGASTKGNVLLQWYGINRRTVDCAADRNPQKVGSRTLGTDIPIVSEAESRARSPITTWSCPGISAKSSCSVRRRRSWRVRG